MKTRGKANGQIDWLEVRRADGSLKKRLENQPNLMLNSMFSPYAVHSGGSGNAYAMSTTGENYIDLDGTWDQSGNTITRATGTGVFPSSPSQLGNELYWYDAGGETGHRCHVTARASDTSITVSGLPKTITGGSLRLFYTNGATGSITYPSGAEDSTSNYSTAFEEYDNTNSVHTRTVQYNFASASSGYTLGSLIVAGKYRVVLSETVDIEEGDQLQYQYTSTETVTGRATTFELDSNSSGLPQKYSMLTIEGDGANVDVTFDGPTHFLAGDKLDLRNVVPERVAISSITSTGTTITVNTATAHGKSVSDSIVIENAEVGAYDGTWEISAVVDTDTFEISDASNPGPSGAEGTVRLETPATFYDDLELATIASMPSTSVARITSAINSVTVDPQEIGGDPGMTVRHRRRGSNSAFDVKGQTTYSGIYDEGSALALLDHTAEGIFSVHGLDDNFDDVSNNGGADYENDFLYEETLTINSGTGTDTSRVKQIMVVYGNYSANGCVYQIDLNTPFEKTEADRFRVTVSKQIQRELYVADL